MNPPNWPMRPSKDGSGGGGAELALSVVLAPDEEGAAWLVPAGELASEVDGGRAVEDAGGVGSEAVVSEGTFESLAAERSVT